MTNRTIGRRAALLATAGLLGGCETFDSIFGTTKKPLPGERRSVLTTDRDLAPDPSTAAEPVTLPAPVAMADWPLAGGNAAHAPGHLALPGNLAEAWRSSIGAGTGYRQRITTGPVIGGGSVFAADAFGVVSAFDLAQGGRRWRFDTRPEDDDAGAIGGGCALSNGVLYVASGMGEVLAMAPADGAVRWRVKLPAPSRGAPAVADGRIMIPTIDNQLVCLSAEDGKRLWSYRAQNALTVPLGLPAPAIEGDIVVAGFASGELVALRALDGRVVWTESAAGAAVAGGLADVQGIRALPVIDRGRVFAMGVNRTTVAVDLRSGRRLWERELGGTETPAVAGDWVFLISDNGNLAAVGREDGRVRWITPLNEAGTERERERRKGARYAAPILAGGRIILPSTLEEALIVDPATGQVAGSLRLPGAVSLPGAVAGNMLVFVTDDGSAVAYRGS
jgi:outer membrane protein assembly factor BamB